MMMSSYVTQDPANTFGPNVTDIRIKPMQFVPSADVNQRLDQNQPDGTTHTSPSEYSISSIPFNHINFSSAISPTSTQAQMFSTQRPTSAQTQLFSTQPPTTEAAAQLPVDTSPAYDLQALRDLGTKIHLSPGVHGGAPPVDASVNPSPYAPSMPTTSTSTSTSTAPVQPNNHQYSTSTADPSMLTINPGGNYLPHGYNGPQATLNHASAPATPLFPPQGSPTRTTQSYPPPQHMQSVAGTPQSFQTPSLYQQQLESSTQAMQGVPTVHVGHPGAMYSTGYYSQAQPTPQYTTATQIPANFCNPMVGMAGSMAGPQMVGGGVSMQQSMVPPHQMLIQAGLAPTVLPPHGRASPVPHQVAVLPAVTTTSVSTQATSGSTGSGSQQPPTAARIKLLLSSGGQFMKNGAGQWEYFGGETRLVTVSHTFTLEELLKDLSKANKSVMDERCQLKYALPGSVDVLVDLINDDDVDNMWDEWQTFTLTDKPTYKLHLYVQIGTDRSRSESDQLSSQSNQSGGSDVSDTDGPADGSWGANSGKGGSFRGVTPPEILVNNGSASKDPRISLLELEGKIEIIAPEDLMLVRFLGAGGYGEVYLCRWHSSNVAVKCLNPSLFTANGGLGNVTEEVVAELVKEANMLGGLRHPNVVWIYGLVLPLGEAVEQLRLRLEPGQTIDAIGLAATAANATGLVPGVIRPPALVTEYLAGGSLNDAIVRKEEYLGSKTIKIKLMLDTARGMEYLHSKRIVHFDLKSGNLLVGFNNRTPMCKVADFGLSKQRQQTYVTGVTSMRGTLPWTAPEIVKTPKAVNDKVDVYSFGIVMWEMWTLREPFEGINYHALLHMMSQQEGLRPALPGSAEWDLGDIDPPAEGWMELMTACWAEAPNDRPCFVDIVQSLTAMLAAARSARRTGS